MAAPVEATSVSEEDRAAPAWSLVPDRRAPGPAGTSTRPPPGSCSWRLSSALSAGCPRARFVKAFINGAADMMSVVLIIALARSITVLMASTGLDMWILENAANALAGMSAIIFAPLSFLLYIVLSFLIPSSSDMATVSIPIMGGLAQPAELLGGDHGHDLLRRQRPREPVHPDLRRYHGRFGPGQDRVLDLAQVRRRSCSSCSGSSAW